MKPSSNVRPLPVRQTRANVDIDTPQRTGVVRRISLMAVLITVLSVMMSYYAVTWLETHLNRPIATVKVEGNFQSLSQQQIEAALAPMVATTFFMIDVEEVRQTVLALPWVSDVAVRRVWPDGLWIKVKEEVAIARWGEKHLLDEEGRVFLPSEGQVLPEGLPLLLGPDGYEEVMMQQYEHVSQLLHPLNKRIAALSLAERGAWELQLDDGMKVMLGRDHMMEKIQRFIRLYQSELAQSSVPILSVDVRYNNGIAVQWGANPDVVPDESTANINEVKS